MCYIKNQECFQNWLLAPRKKTTTQNNPVLHSEQIQATIIILSIALQVYKCKGLVKLMFNQEITSIKIHIYEMNEEYESFKFQPPFKF